MSKSFTLRTWDERLLRPYPKEVKKNPDFYCCAVCGDSASALPQLLWIGWEDKEGVPGSACFGCAASNPDDLCPCCKVTVEELILEQL